jgi:F0F1-type ATP synthase alpha subunit
MREWEQALLRYMDTSRPEIGRDILEKKRLSDETIETLRKALDEFTSSWA